MKANDYPVKYAILELKEPGGYLYGYEDLTRGFIAAKCWVISSKIIYRPNGESIIKHEVVFPYQDLAYFKRSMAIGQGDIGQRTIVEYNACNEAYPVNFVANLYDTFAEAKVAAKAKNNQFCHGDFRMNPVSLTDRYNKKSYAEVVAAVKEEIAICELFEKVVFIATEDMKITNENEEAFKLLRHKKTHRMLENG